MAADLSFTAEEMAIDEVLGYPKAYAKLHRDRRFRLYSHGPPFTFTPYALQENEAVRAKELDELFPIIDPKAKPTVKPKIFASLLWKQLNHLGNAGFDPEKFRIDQYGNVLYYHADSASPLAWEIDHWFPCSRGGLTVPSNLRILQWQVCKKKHHRLELLVPWWDLQVGISVNQFLSIFASSNSDFRRRAFSLLFSEGENEELNSSQTVDSHAFPQHFSESKAKFGLAPAAVVVSRRESLDASSTLKSLDINRLPRSKFPLVVTRKLGSGISEENENPEIVSNPYQAIVMARDSLREQEETAKMQAEIQKLDDEVTELRQTAEEEKVTIQDLELLLIKRRRRAEKCRRLTEAQSSYRATLEKMIRDAMHQSVVYKEQVRLNQAAANALMARLEAQKAICDASEKELHRKFKQRDELEKQIRPEWEQTRKRSRMNDSLFDEKSDKMVLYVPESKPYTQRENELDGNRSLKQDDKTIRSLQEIKSKSPLHKELRVLLKEEQKAYEAGLFLNEEQLQEKLEEECKESIHNISKGDLKECNNAIITTKDEYQAEEKHVEDEAKVCKVQFPVREPKREEDEDSRKERGKGNVEKWLQMLLENSQEGTDLKAQNDEEMETSRSDERIRKLNLIYPHKEIKILKSSESQDKAEGTEQIHEARNKQTRQKKKNDLRNEGAVEKEGRFKIPNKQHTAPDEDDQNSKEGIKIESRNMPAGSPPCQLLSDKSNKNEVAQQMGVGISNDSEEQATREDSGKEKGLMRSESARAFRRIPSSPSLILSMKKGVDCMRKKPLVIGDDDGNEGRATGNFLKSSIRTIKKAVKM